MNEKNSLQIVLEKIELLAGEEVRGKIIINSTLDQADAPVIRFVGKERTHFAYNQERSPQSLNLTQEILRHTMRYSGKNTIFQASFTLGDEEKISQGQRTFPFNYKIPTSAPPSIKFKSNAFISYYIEASFADKKEAKSFYVVDPPVTLEIGRTTQSRDQSDTVSCCGCYNSGQVKFRATFQQSVYEPRGKVNVVVDVDNTKSTWAINRIRAVGLCQVLVKSTMGAKLFRHITGEGSFTKRIEAGQKARGVPISFELNCPPNWYPVKTKYIWLRQFILVEVYTEDRCCSSLIKTIEFEIQMKPVVKYSNPSEPRRANNLTPPVAKDQGVNGPNEMIKPMMPNKL